MTIGERLQRIFDREGWTQDEAARRLKVSRYSVNQLVNGRRRITATMALRFERVFGDRATYWLELQSEADLAAARAKTGGRR